MSAEPTTLHDDAPDCGQLKHYDGHNYFCRKTEGHNSVHQDGDARWIAGFMVAPLPAPKGGADRG